PALHIPERPLDAAVLERVETDDRRPAARPQAARQGVEQAVEGGQLVVHRDPQRLKDARRRVDALPLAARAGVAAPHQLRELRGRGDRLLLARLDDAAGDAPAEALLPVVVKD